MCHAHTIRPHYSLESGPQLERDAERKESATMWPYVAGKTLHSKVTCGKVSCFSELEG
jgi:hypothetical protein